MLLPRLVFNALAGVALFTTYHGLAAAQGSADLNQGLVAHWTFDEGGGSTAEDVTGNGNMAILGQGASWTAGKNSAGALQFDGAEGQAVVTPATFDGTGDMTIAAWVRPSRDNTRTFIFDMLSWRKHVSLQMIQYGGDASLCFANAGNGVLCAGSGALLSHIDSWAHIAVTRPRGGGNSKIYVNGQQIAAGSVGPDISGATWWGIGGAPDIPAAQAFQGAIDDLRVYNRVLNAAELRPLADSSDGSFSISINPADLSAPIRSEGAPNGELSADTREVALSLSTNEPATCRYDTSGGVGYHGMTKLFSNTGGASHTTQISSLSSGAAYQYSVRCEDTSGNVNTDDFTISFSVAETQSPATDLSVNGLVAHWAFDEGAGTTAGDVSHNGNTVTLLPGASWTQGVVGSGALQLDGEQGQAQVSGATHDGANDMTIAAWVKPLKDNTRTFIFDMLRWAGSKHISLQLIQRGGNAQLCFFNSDNGVVCTASGELLPYIGKWAHIAVTRPSQGANTRIYVNGQQAAVGNVGPDIAGARWWAIGGAPDIPTAQAFLGAIDDFRVYNRVLTAEELQPLADTGDSAVIQPVDTTAPVRSSASPTGMLPSGTSAAELALSTNEPAVCKFSTTPGAGFASMPATFNSTGGTSHATPLSSLSDGSAYSYYVRCRDNAGNANSNDFPISFSIASSQITDGTPPSVTITHPSAGASVSGNVNVTATATDNTGVTKVEFYVDGSLAAIDTGSPYGFPWMTAQTTTGAHTIAAKAFDAAGNSRTHSVSVTVPSTDAGARYYVSPNGSDSNPGTIDRPWRTIIKAVNAMQPGETTFVRQGTYNTFVPIGWSAGEWAKNGTPEAPITLRAYPGETVVWQSDPSYPKDKQWRHEMIDIRNRSYWVIEGFYFDNNAPSPATSEWWTYGMNVYGPAKGVVIRNNTFHGNGIVRTGGVVIDVRYAVEDSVIEGNHIVDFPSFSDLMGVALESNWRSVQREEGILLNRNTVIRHNEIHRVGGDCIQIAEWGGYNTLIENNRCYIGYNDSLHGTSEEFLDIKKSWFTTVRGNVAWGSRPKGSSSGGAAMIVHLNAQDIVVEDNLFYDNGLGIGLGVGWPGNWPSWYEGERAPQRITIRRNLIYGSNKKPSYTGSQGSGNGIGASGIKGLKIYNNTIALSAGSALELENNQAVEVYNNIFYRSSHRHLYDISTGQTNWNQLTVDGNLFDDHDPARSLCFRKADGDFFSGDVAKFRNQTGQCTNCVQGDPLLINPILDSEQADFHLQGNSPAIDAGILVPGEYLEYVGSGPDMGVFESAP